LTEEISHKEHKGTKNTKREERVYVRYLIVNVKSYRYILIKRK
jgi:hypothetical protein